MICKRENFLQRGGGGHKKGGRRPPDQYFNFYRPADAQWQSAGKEAAIWNAQKETH